MDLSLTEIAMIIDNDKGPGYFARQLEQPFGDFIKTITEVPDDYLPMSPTEILMKDDDGKLLDWAQKSQDRLQEQFKQLGGALWKHINIIKKMKTTRFIQEVLGGVMSGAGRRGGDGGTEHTEGAPTVNIGNADEVGQSLWKRLKERKGKFMGQFKGREEPEKKEKTFLGWLIGGILKWGSIGAIVVGIVHLWNNNPAFKGAMLKIVGWVSKMVGGAWDWVVKNVFLNTKLWVAVGEIMFNSFVGALKMAWEVIKTIAVSSFGDVGAKFKEGFLAGLGELLKGVVKLFGSVWLLSLVPVIGTPFKFLLKGFGLLAKTVIPHIAKLLMGVGKLLMGAGKLLLSGVRLLLANPIVAVIAAAAVAAAQVTKSVKAFKGMRQAQKESWQAEVDMLNYAATVSRKKGAERSVLEERLSKLNQFNPKTEEERLWKIKEIGKVERNIALKRIQAEQAILIARGKADSKENKALQKELKTVYHNQLLFRLDELGDTEITKEMKTLLEEGLKVGSHNARFVELQRSINSRFDKSTGKLIDAVEKQADETKKLTDTVAQGAAAQVGATNAAGNATIQALRQTAQPEINVKSTVEFERIFGFREMARNFIYPERIGMKAI